MFQNVFGVRELLVVYVVFIKKSNAFYSENLTDVTGNTKILEKHYGCCITEQKCGKLCLYHPKCMSFFYNDQFQQCQLHYDAIQSSQTLLPSQGSKYFVMSDEVLGSRCSNDWIVFKGKCYLASTYGVSNWYNATSLCSALNASLAIISSEQENMFMSSLAGSRIISSSHGFWLDGTDNLQEGQWIWNNTGEPFTYVNWYTNEPNGNTHENCLFMYKPYDYKWIDIPCDWTNNQNQFICQKTLVINSSITT